MLQNKELRDLIREINGHSRPPDKLKIAMYLPVFREFVDECLAVCDQSTLLDNASPDTHVSCVIILNIYKTHHIFINFTTLMMSVS